MTFCEFPLLLLFWGACKRGKAIKARRNHPTGIPNSNKELSTALDSAFFSVFQEFPEFWALFSAMRALIKIYGYCAILRYFWYCNICNICKIAICFLCDFPLTSLTWLLLSFKWKGVGSAVDFWILVNSENCPKWLVFINMQTFLELSSVFAVFNVSENV